MNRSRKQRDYLRRAWICALAISILLHIVLVLGITGGLEYAGSMGRSWQYANKLRDDSRGKEVVIRVPWERKALDTRDDEIDEQDKRPPFVKTSPRQEADREPLDAPYVGERPTLAEGGPKPPDDYRELPAQDGEKRDDELVLFDQDRQDGTLEHDRDGNPGNNGGRPPPQGQPADAANANPQNPADPALAEGIVIAPAVPRQESEHHDKPSEGRDPHAEHSETSDSLVDATDDAPPNEPSEEQLNDREVADNREGADADMEGVDDQGVQDGMDLLARAFNETNHFPDLIPNDRRIERPLPSGLNGDSPQNRQMPFKTPQAENDLFAAALNGGGTPSSNDGSPRPVYDPAFSPQNQPGFKTNERKTKTSGNFVFGKEAALNVAPTPMGQYQAIIYRAIGQKWYKQCDRNWDVIVPGTLWIRILVDTKGKIADIRMVKQSGASTNQASFTYLSIQTADIPAMPPAVARELVGDKLEMIIGFRF